MKEPCLWQIPRLRPLNHPSGSVDSGDVESRFREKNVNRRAGAAANIKHASAGGETRGKFAYAIVNGLRIALLRPVRGNPIV